MIFLQFYARSEKEKLEKIHVKIMYVYFVLSNYTVKSVLFYTSGFDTPLSYT